MKRILLILLLFIGTWLSAQPGLSLYQVLETAQEQSLDAFRARNMYLANYWQYQSYKSKQLPHLWWDIKPVTYNRRMTSRYDFENDLEVYRQQQTLNSYSNLSLSQNIVATGGNIYVESDVSRLQNYGDENITQWSTTPFRIGFNQPVFGFNRFKWEKKISPLKFEKAKQDYIQSVQNINSKGVSLFFSYVMATVSRDIAANNVATADTLYKTGKLRFEIASIQHEELLDLELSKFNAKIDLAQADKSVEKTRFNLNSFLGKEDVDVPQPSLPGVIEGLEINIEEAIVFAQELNPMILQLKQNILEAEKVLDRAEKDTRFNANLNASYGLNQSAAQLNKAYEQPLDQQMVSVSVRIPLMDWGDGRGQRHMAQKQKEVAEIEVEQALTDFKQEVALKVIDFNLQSQVVQSAAKADTLAQRSYELTKKRFLLGKADVLKLTNAMKARQSAREKYINSLATYWRYYYEVQKLTLYDFRKNIALSEDFDALLEE